MKIDWNSTESHIFFNPYLKNTEKIRRKLSDQELEGHIWISSSGTNQQNETSKWIALSKEAILTSANAVNEHLEATSEDSWLLALPFFHIGGVAISARCHASCSPLIEFSNWSKKWSPEIYLKALLESRATLSAIVPTQLYDLVKLNLKAPETLRAVVIGGSSLSRHLYIQARNLGWKILPSYGLTECASQVATAELSSLSKSCFPKLKILNHVSAKVNKEGSISLKSDSLLTFVATITGDKATSFDPKKNGFYATEDQGICQGNFLQVKGRIGEVVKISGENVDMQKLQDYLSELKMKLKVNGDHVLAAIPDERLGHSICLAISHCKKEEVLPLQKAFNETVMPFERIKTIKKINQIPKSQLGKVLKIPLLKLIVCQML